MKPAKTYDLDADPVLIGFGCLAIVLVLALALIGIGWLFGVGLRLAGF